MGHREREGQDPGQGGHPARPAASDLRRQAAGGRPHAVGLQHPEGVDAPPGAPPARREVNQFFPPSRLTVCTSRPAVSPCSPWCLALSRVTVHFFLITFPKKK